MKTKGSVTSVVQNKEGIRRTYHAVIHSVLGYLQFFLENNRSICQETGKIFNTTLRGTGLRLQREKSCSLIFGSKMIKIGDKNLEILIKSLVNNLEKSYQFVSSKQPNLQ